MIKSRDTSRNITWSRRVAKFEHCRIWDLVQLQSLTAMFKNILPGRRIPSGEFTFVTPGNNGASKENLPAMIAKPQVATKPRPNSKALVQAGDKKKTKKAKDSQPNDPVVSPQAFDQLLVSTVPTSTSAVECSSG